MNEEAQLIQRQQRFAASDIPTLSVSVWRLDSNDDISDCDSPESSVHEARVIDFSSRGLKIALPFAAQFNEVLAVRLDFLDIQYSYKGQATIRHIRAENDRWIAGCSIEPTIVEEVIDHLVSLSGKERRKHPRTLASGEGNVRRSGDVKGKPASIVNISKGGACLAVSEAMTVGERIQFQILNQKRDLETVALQVRWQSKTADGHRVGCSFCESKAYRKIRFCKHEESAIAELIKQQQVSWYVIAGAVLAMLVPPAVQLTMELTDSPAETALATAGPEVIFESASVAETTPVDTSVKNMVAAKTTEPEPSQPSTEPTAAPERKVVVSEKTDISTKAESQPLTVALTEPETAAETAAETEPENTELKEPELALSDIANVDELEVETVVEPELEVVESPELASTEPDFYEPEVTTAPEELVSSEPLDYAAATPEVDYTEPDFESQQSLGLSSQVDLPKVNDVRTDRGVPDVPFDVIPDGLR